MLEAIKECPDDICRAISPMDTLKGYLAIICMIIVDIKLYNIMSHFAFDIIGLTVMQFLVSVTTLSLLITAGLYIYYTEIVHWKLEPSKKSEFNIFH